MKSHDLRDNWCRSGTEIETFKEAIEDIAKSTYVVDVTTDNLTLLHYLGSDKGNDDLLLFSVFSKKQMESRKNIGTSLDSSSLRSSGVTPAFIDELKDSSKLMLRLGGVGAQREDFYFTSSHLSRDLAARAQLGGDAVYDPTSERDMYIVSRYMKKPMDIMAVIRRNSEENNAVQKVFALPTSAYRQIDQRILIDMIAHLEAELGKSQCKSWYIDHFITQIRLIFPEYAEDICKTYGLPEVLTPGILLETSDTGDSSVKAIAFWEHAKHAHARIGTYEREHRGNVSESDILSNLNSRLMPKYTELPQRLAELLTIDIDDPVAAVEAIFHMAHFSKAIGKKRAANLRDVMTELVASRSTMTGYELAVLFMDIPTQFSMDDIARNAIEDIAGRVPFLDFNVISKATTKVTLA